MSTFGLGHIIGKQWFILGELGAGGNGTVFRCRHQHDMKHPQVAVKVLNSDLSFQGGNDRKNMEMARFTREKNLMEKIDHPHVIRLLEYGMERMEMPGRTVTIPFLVMELADAGSVDGYLRRYGPLSPEMATWFILQAVRGLKATRTIHRDIKPGNLLIFHGKTSKKPEKPHFTPGTLEGSRIVITDFGLAKETDGASGLTKSAMAFGTPDYMSPEQCRDAKRVSIEGDIYSLGIMFYELMLGHTPFRSEDDSPMSIMKRQVEEIPEIPDTVPTAQSNIIARCLEKAPEDRYRTLSSLEEALRSIYQWPKSMDAVPEPTRQAESETSTWLSKATSWFTKKPT